MTIFNREALEGIHKECLDLGAKKSKDYGAVADAIAMAGVPGVVTRMLDKQVRLLSLTKPGHEMAVKDESLRDTLMDMVNYATYAISLLDGSWGKRSIRLLGDLKTPAVIAPNGAHSMSVSSLMYPLPNE